VNADAMFADCADGTLDVAARLRFMHGLERFVIYGFESDIKSPASGPRHLLQELRVPRNIGTNLRGPADLSLFFFKEGAELSYPFPVCGKIVIIEENIALGELCANMPDFLQHAFRRLHAEALAENFCYRAEITIKRTTA